MASVSRPSNALVVRLLLVAAVALSHCCLLGHSAWAAGMHGDGVGAHGAAATTADATWGLAPEAPMVCGGAHGVAAVRPAVPSPGAAALPVVATTRPVGGPLPRSVPARAHPPDPRPPSRSRLQVFLI